MTGRILEVTTIEELTTTTDREEQLALFEIEEQERKVGSVVKSPYKTKYKNRAKAAGIRGKAAKRSTWDWVAQRMAEQTLTKKAKTDVDGLIEFLEANGIDDPLERWPSQTPGWEGRLRMTGGLAVRRIIAERGTLFLRDGTELEVPADELERLQAKYDF
jgi:hypothetical protein